MSDSKTEVPEEIPIMMKMSGMLVFTAEGEWLHDGEKITHERIRDYFSKHLRYVKDHGTYVIEVSGKCVPVTVEDTPVVVRTLDLFTTPWTAKLSDGTEKPFAPETLTVSGDGVFYCFGEEKNQQARLLRPAWQALLPYISETNGEYTLDLDGRSTRIRRLPVV